MAGSGWVRQQEHENAQTSLMSPLQNGQHQHLQLKNRQHASSLAQVPNNSHLPESVNHQDKNKLMKREHDASSEHDEVTYNPPKQKQLFLTFTEFDEDNGKDPNDISYHAKDNVIDDGLKYLGTEPSARGVVESVDITHQHQWDLDSSWVKDAHKGSLKIKPEGLMDQKRDCTAILTHILEQAHILNIFLMGSDVPEDPSLHELWYKAQMTGFTFIHFHHHWERLLGNIMGIQRIHNPPALRCRQVKNDKMHKSFCPWCCKYGWNTPP